MDDEPGSCRKPGALEPPRAHHETLARRLSRPAVEPIGEFFGGDPPEQRIKSEQDEEAERGQRPEAKQRPAEGKGALRHASTSAIRARSAGSRSSTNHGLRRSQAVVRQEGWGSGTISGQCARKSRTRAVICPGPSTWVWA